ncbi:MAG: DUF6291 domain-containing protein [Planctomycetota bacterium]
MFCRLQLILDEMDNVQAGKFIKAIFQYQITGQLPQLDFSLKMAVSPFINQFKRDEQKWVKSEIGGRIGNLKKYHSDIYDKYSKKEITLEEAESLAYPHKKDIESRPPIAPDRPRSLNVSVNVSDSVSVNDIYQNPTKKPQPKFNDFHLQVAKQLGEFVKENKKINLKMGDIKRWANDIRLLQDNDLKPRHDSQQDIINAMQSVIDNSGNEYFPVIESGSSFRKKFTSIENYKKSPKNTKELEREKLKREREAIAQHYAKEENAGL